MKNLIYIILLACFTTNTEAKSLLSIKDAIRIGHENSLDAMIARLNFMSHYWAFRAFKAELLPAVNMNGNLMEFNRSIVETRNYETGEISMVKNNTMSNNLSLSVSQAIVPLGGQVSIQSYLYRLDQFSYDKKTYNSQPFRITYSQPLKAFNSLRWNKKTEPMKYEKAKRNYLESMEDITMNTVNLYFSVLSAQSAYQQCIKTLNDRQNLYAISEKRFNLGSITKNDLLQLKLSLINAEVEKNRMEIELKSQRFKFFSYLRIRDFNAIELIAPTDIPSINVNTDDVIQKALNNSGHVLTQQLNILDAEKALKQAKAAKGIQISLYGEAGFTRTANHLGDAYRNLENSEIVGLTFSMPIFDWGMGKGRTRMAKADLEAVKAQMDQAREKYIEDLQTITLKFNLQSAQCSNAQQAKDIAEERYDITKKRFESGTINVTELNTAQQELEMARNQFISELQTFWNIYYTLRRSTLYDWIKNSDISANFDEIVFQENNR